MQSFEFETYISHNCINIPIIYPQLNNHKAKINIELTDINNNGNYNKSELVSALEKLKKSNVFINIENSIIWQQELRNEWE